MACFARLVCVMNLFLSLTKLSVCVALGKREGWFWICVMLASKNTDRVSTAFTLKEIPLLMLIPHLQ